MNNTPRLLALAAVAPMLSACGETAGGATSAARARLDLALSRLATAGIAGAEAAAAAHIEALTRKAEPVVPSGK